MKPSQIWLDLSSVKLKVWMNEKLELAVAKGSNQQRVGFYREIPLFALAPSSAHPMGWTSFFWDELVGRVHFEADFWPGLEALRINFLNERPEKFIPPLLIEYPLASDVIFYGGTFDPWHEGHSTCVKLAPRDFPLVVCPDRNPHKPLRQEKDILAYLSHLNKTLRGLNTHPNIHLHPGFMLKNERNPTVNWVLRLKRNRPDLRVHLLIGYDSFKNLSTWTNATDLIKLINGLYVVSRLESDVTHQDDAAWALSHNPKIQIQFLGHHEYENVSATQLRG